MIPNHRARARAALFCRLPFLLVLLLHLGGAPGSARAGDSTPDAPGSAPASATASAPDVAPPPVALERHYESLWGADIRRFEEADRESPPPQGAALFIGSSSIRFWSTLARDFPNTAVINRGFGGCQMDDVLYFADRILIPYRPRIVVVYAGDNDLNGGLTPEQVAANFRSLVKTVEDALPRTKIAFLAIKPSPSRWHLAAAVRRTNALVQEMTTTDPNLRFIDVFTPMLGKDGTPRPELFLEDRLHLNAAGYALWTRIVAPYL